MLPGDGYDDDGGDDDDEDEDENSDDVVFVAQSNPIKTNWKREPPDQHRHYPSVFFPLSF